MLTKCSIIKAFTCFIIDNYDVYDAYWDIPAGWDIYMNETLAMC